MRILTSISKTGKRTYKEDMEVSFPTKNNRKKDDTFKKMLEEERKK